MKLLVCLCMVVSLNTIAQELKVGYTNAEYILSVMPEAKTIDSDLKTYESQLQGQLKDKYDRFQTKATNYQNNAGTMAEPQRKQAEKELQDLQSEIQKFESEAQQKLTNKRTELLSPVFQKIGKAIEEVAKENGYTHILSTGSSGYSVVLYARDQDNVSNLVLAKLGIDPPAATTND